MCQCKLSSQRPSQRRSRSHRRLRRAGLAGLANDNSNYDDKNNDNDHSSNNEKGLVIIELLCLNSKWYSPLFCYCLL